MSFKNKLISVFISIALVLSFSTATASATGLTLDAELNGKLVILHTNDIHGAFETTDESLGIAGVKSLKEYYQNQGASVLLFDAGDFSQGTTLVNYFEGSNAAEYMVAAGYDAVTLGNHEFDFGFDSLLLNRSILENSYIEVLSSNIVDKGTDNLTFLDNKTYTKNGIKVGVFALTTAETQYQTQAENVSDISFLDAEEMYANAQASVDELLAEGCDYVIALTHLGTYDETNTNSDAIDVAENVTGIDIIIDGHTHTEIDGGIYVNDTLIVSTGSELENVGAIIIGDDGIETVGLISDEVYAVEIGNYDSTLTNMVATDLATIEEAYGEVIASSEITLSADDEIIRTQESTLGNLVADSMLYIAQNFNSAETSDLNVVAAIVNSGGVRSDIAEGELSLNTLSEILPYSNNLYFVTLTGEQLVEMLEASTYSSPIELSSFPQVSGIEFTINTAIEFENGELYTDSKYYSPANENSRIEITSIGGEEFDINSEYTIIINSYMLGGGDTYGVLSDCSYSFDTSITDLEALTEYIESLGNVITEEMYGETDGRITYISELVVSPSPEAEESSEVSEEESLDDNVPTGEDNMILPFFITLTFSFVAILFIKFKTAK